jgi:hypothetical protein
MGTENMADGSWLPGSITNGTWDSSTASGNGKAFITWTSSSVTQKVGVLHSSNYNIPSSASGGDFTYSFWAKQSSINTNWAAYFEHGFYYQGILFRQTPADLQLYLNNGTSPNPLTYPYVPPLGEWVFFVITREGVAGTIKVYANGKRLPGTYTYTSAITFAAPLVIGAASHRTDEFVIGSIDNFRIYKRAFGIAEIEREYMNKMTNIAYESHKSPDTAFLAGLVRCVPSI